MNFDWKGTLDPNYSRDTRKDMHGNLLYNYVTKDTMDNYKTRLSNAIIENGMDCEYIDKNGTAKSYISTWVETNVTGKKIQNDIQGITFNFAYLDLGIHSKNEEVKTMVFPVINKYKGHNLVETIYFSIDKNGAMMEKIIPLEEKIIKIQK